MKRENFTKHDLNLNTSGKNILRKRLAETIEHLQPLEALVKLPMIEMNKESFLMRWRRVYIVKEMKQHIFTSTF